MRIPATSVRAYEFACRSKACAPPPVGVGGSKDGAARAASDERKVDAALGRGKYDKLTEKALAHGAEKAKTAEKVREITAAEARGDSRPVSSEEFQRLARTGLQQLAGFEARKSPHTGLDDNWNEIKVNAYAEVTKSWGGATIDAHTGNTVPQGANVFAITVKGGRETVSVPENASRADFSKAMDEAKARFSDILQRESHYLGVFHDDENKRIDIDPVLIVRYRDQVDTIGAASHSIGGAYNFADGNGYWPPHVRE